MAGNSGHKYSIPVNSGILGPLLLMLSRLTSMAMITPMHPTTRLN